MEAEFSQKAHFLTKIFNQRTLQFLLTILHVAKKITTSAWKLFKSGAIFFLVS